MCLKIENPINKLNSEEFFPVEILPSTNTVFDAVGDAESHDIKSSVKFYGNPMPEILIKIRK